MDLDDNEKKGKFLFWDTAEDFEGEVLVRISVSNDDIRRVKYRYIEIY